MLAALRPYGELFCHSHHYGLLVFPQACVFALLLWSILTHYGLIIGATYRVCYGQLRGNEPTNAAGGHHAFLELTASLELVDVDGARAADADSASSPMSDDEGGGKEDALPGWLRVPADHLQAALSDVWV